MYDYGWRDRQRLIKNQHHEEANERVADWLLLITVLYFGGHLVYFFWG